MGEIRSKKCGRSGANQGSTGSGTRGCPDGSAVDDGKGGVHIVFDWSTGLGAPGPNADNGLGYECALPCVPNTRS